jgi:cell wall-associated NlpC family hydrolase
VRARPARPAPVTRAWWFVAVTAVAVPALLAAAPPAASAGTTTTRPPSIRSTTTTTRPPTHAPSQSSTRSPVATTTTTTISDQAIAAKQTEADQVAATLRQQGERLERLAERVNGAHLRIGQLDRQLAEAQSQASETLDRLHEVAAVLRVQAVAAYVRGGKAALLTYGIGGAQPDDWARRQVYAETVAGDQVDALSQLGELRKQLDAQQAQLARDRQAAASTLSALQADEQAAARLDLDRQATLAKVQGQLASLVRAAQARRAALEAARVQSELAARQRARLAATPPRTRAGAPAGGGGTTATGHAVTARPGGFSPTSTAPSSPGDGPGQTGAAGPPAKGWATAIDAAEQELGKPYQWGAEGPDSFDCSGLMVWAWSAAGVALPHLAQDQYNLTRRVAISDLLPGDMVFYGTPSNVHHVGLYVGNGTMIEAPATGEVVRDASIFRADLLSGGRLPS